MYNESCRRILITAMTGFTVICLLLSGCDLRLF